MKTLAALCLLCSLSLFAFTGCGARSTESEPAPPDDATETAPGMDYMSGEGEPPE